MTTTTHLGLVLVEQNQSQKEVTVNEALVAIDAVLNTGAIDKDLATPPLSPSTGDVYIVGGLATYDWEGHENQLAWYHQGWRFIIPREGMLIWVNDEDKLYCFDGTDWAESGVVNALDDLSDVSLTGISDYQLLQYNGSEFVNTAAPENLDGVGINTSPDSTNKLAVASDAVLFSHNGSGCQVKINKDSTGDTASFLYQTGFSGRAEFGTVGDDHFQLKVSPDGSSFYQSFVVDNATGNVAFKQVVNHEDNRVERPELKDYAETLTIANSGSSYTVNLENGNVFEITLTDNCTFTFSNAPVSGKAGSFTLILKQDATGGRVTTWPASIDWPNGNAPTLTTTANAVDILTFMTTDGGTLWWGFLSGGDMQ